MKKTLLLMLLLIPLISSAQFSKGHKFIGGSFSFGGSYYSPYPQRINHRFSVGSYSIAPTLGFLLTEKVAVGGKFGYGKNIHQPYSDSKFFSTGAFIRRYLPITDNFLFSIDANLSYARFSFYHDIHSSENRGKSYQLGASIVPSIIFFPTPNISIEASIGAAGFTHHRNLSGDYQTNKFGIDYGSFSLGVFYYLRKS